MRDWFNEHHPFRPPNTGMTGVTHPTFKCPVCKESHQILGSKQKRNKVLNKLIRYCVPCYEKKYGSEVPERS